MRSFLPQGSGCFKTASRITINVLDPKPEMIELHDIVQGLAYKAHFSGQINQYFSIAEHCILTEHLVAIDHMDDHELRLIALLHDASEAYIGDMISPIKVLIPKFKEMEMRLQSVIFDKFGLPIDRLQEVKKYDLAAQDIEATVFYKMTENPRYHQSKAMICYKQPDEAARSIRTAIQIRMNKLRNYEH